MTISREHAFDDGVDLDNPPLVSSIVSVFSTPDLLVDILGPLIDGDFLPTLSTLALVSKSFLQATRSNQFWKAICLQRWKTKWGFHPRWERALLDYSHHLSIQNHAGNQSKGTDSFWMSRYFFEEQDAHRKLVRAGELELLVWDFRFFIGQPTVVDGKVVVKSGLLRSASREVRFIKPVKIMDGESSDDDDETAGPTWSARGFLAGHPCLEPGIEWFLDESSGVLQWGFTPDLWPQGSVQRLGNWGWQIQNPNVILRSLDPSPSLSSKLSDWDKRTLGEIERECSKNDGHDEDNLWRDLLDTLEIMPLPLVNGSSVSAEIPRMFIEQFES